MWFYAKARTSDLLHKEVQMDFFHLYPNNLTKNHIILQLKPYRDMFGQKAKTQKQFSILALPVSSIGV